MYFTTAENEIYSLIRAYKTLELLRSRSNLVLPLASLLGEKSLMDVWQNTSIGNRDGSQKLAKLFIVPHRKLNVPRNNTVLLVVPRSVPSQFQNLNTHATKNKFNLTEEITRNTKFTIKSTKKQIN